MLIKTVRWSLTIVLLTAIFQYVAPAAFADTILELPRSDARLFCANSLTSTTLVQPEVTKPVITEAVIQAPPPIQYVPQEKPTASLNPALIMELINNYRASIGRPAFQTDTAICEVAKQRGPELDHEVEVGAIHAGFRARNLPYWATENMKYGGNEHEMFAWWLNSYIHRQAIEGDYTYSCGECYGKSCVQLFTSYQPK